MFHYKQTMAETIGQQLKHAREERYLSIAQVAEQTRIRAHYIEAMEADDFDFLPSAAQARGFLRLYAEHLGLALDDLISRQRGQTGPAAAPETPAPPLPAETQAEAESAPPPPPETPRKSRRKQLKPAKTGAPDSNTSLPDSPQPAGPETAAPDSAPPQPAQEKSPSQVIFASIGDQLRSRREALSLTLEEIERHTHVRIHYLQALEKGEFDRLPSSVQARGMLNNYAHFINLDVDAVLLKFADALQAQLQERQPAPDAAQASAKKTGFRLPAFVRRYLTTDLIVGGGLILFLIVFAVWATIRVVNLSARPTPEATAPSISDILIASPDASQTPTATIGQSVTQTVLVGDATSIAAAPTGGQGAVQVVLVTLGSTWARVTVDGKIQFEGRLSPGTANSYNANKQIEVLTGDGAALSVTYNQAELGPMGSFGEVVDRIYTQDAILNPTPTFTPTFTISPIPSATPRPSATARFSPVPSRTP